MTAFRNWLLNAPISKKFFPIQIISFILIVTLGVLSITSLTTVNNLSQKVFNENVQNTEMLTEITETMYVCRVLGRDILFEENEHLIQSLYNNYLVSFKRLDIQMQEFVNRLEGKKLEVFNSIIIKKDIYKESMLLSANIKMKTGNDREALDALQSVTPIANEFFSSIDQFLRDEKLQMADILDKNDIIVSIVLYLTVLINILIATVLLLMIRAFAKTMSKSLISLEKSVTEIANTGDMSINIPNDLFTKDEIGFIAIAINKLKFMLLNHSFRDALTGGFNSTAYYDELSDIFGIKEGLAPQKRFWCIIFDINNLKQINDQYGHFEGDIVIKGLHAIMLECFSNYGKIFRVGGDEFVSILNKCSKEEIEVELNKMEALIKAENQKTEYLLSIAWGCEEFNGSTREEFDEFYKLVDKKMYQNKKISKQ